MGEDWRGWGGRAPEADRGIRIKNQGRQALSTQASQRGHHRIGEDRSISHTCLPRCGAGRDARLYHRAMEKWVKAAREREIRLRQSYRRKSKELIFLQGRYRHARQMKRARKCTNKLKTYLGRVIRDIRRRFPEPDEKLKELLEISQKIFEQKRNDKHKVYSLHAPEVSCIVKGKAHKKYEFGCKVSVGVTSKGGWLIGARAFHGNPYDGHTLREALKQVERLSPKRVDHVFGDMGYRGHHDEGEAGIQGDKRRRGRIPKSLWRWMKRRAAVEPSIGHLKQGY